MDDVVSSLDLREEKVIRLRFGIGTKLPLLLKKLVKFMKLLESSSAN